MKLLDIKIIFQIGKSKKSISKLNEKLKILILVIFLKRKMILLLAQTASNNVEIKNNYFKPHQTQYIHHLINIEVLKTKPLINILNDYDIIYSTNPSSAALDAYLLNKYLIVQISYDGLNFSPLKGLTMLNLLV